MPTYSMPVIMLIDADSLTEAEQAMEDWNDELEMDSMPLGCENVVHNPDCEITEDHKILYLPLDEEADEDEDDVEEDDDLDE